MSSRRLLSRLAWYFGIRWGDPGFESEPSAPERPSPARLVLSALIAGTVFALLTWALDGFADPMAAAVRGAAFGVLLTLFRTLIEHRASNDRNDRPASREPDL